MVEHAEAIPEHGVIGIDWRGLAHQYPRKRYYREGANKEVLVDIEVMSTTNVFGDMFISQSLRNKIGVFCEDYSKYGLWDSDYSIRATAAGRENFYINGLVSTHFGDDVGQNTEYRKMKDESLKAARPIFDANYAKYMTGDYFIPKYTKE
jgi:hypothetical protein